MLCSAHHRALHRGSLVIEGRSAKALLFRHADGSAFRGPVSARAAGAHRQAFAALRGLGFGESDVKKALAQLGFGVSVDSGSVEEIVRAALRALTAETCVAPYSKA
jgi:Holliday junction resolvasome RuvABC DNA-binding subunit